MESVMDRQPGDSEAEAAIRGMQETYGPAPLPAIGQWVTGRTGRRTFSGEVSESEPGRVVVEIDGAWLIVTPSEIDPW